jgi:biotin transport system substrate-specific component
MTTFSHTLEAIMTQLKARPWVRHALLVVGVSLAIALTGRFKIDLPFTPVPIVLQNTAVLLAAFLLGAKRGIAATALFLLQGAAGLPVFAGGAGGAHCFFGPTGGYLAGYLIASFVVGSLSDRIGRQANWKIFGTMATGSAVIFAAGASFLSLFIGWKAALSQGVLPFLLGDLLKLGAAVKLAQWFKIGAASRD